MTTYAPDVTISTEKYAPLKPFRHYKPLRIAEDTYLIQQLLGEGTGAPFNVPMNSMLILGDEPIIVDTNTVGNRQDFLNDVFSLVAPEDVKWIYISHDDHDHVGNLVEVLEMCPNANLVSTMFQVERLSGDLALPLDRMRWVNNNESFRVGNHELLCVRPPSYDSPTTRGLFDPRTGVYWSVDCFAHGVQGSLIEDASENDPDFWRETFMMFGNMVSPWLSSIDPAKHNAAVDQIAALKPKVIAGAHNVTLTGREVDRALAWHRELAGAPEVPLPTQADLDAILKQIAGHG